MKAKCTLLLLLVLGFINLVLGQTVEPTSYYPMVDWDSSPYKSFKFSGKNNDGINFRLLFPIGYDSAARDNKKFPLTIILHGTGESARLEWKNPIKKNTPYPAGDERIDNNDNQLLFGGLEHLNARNNGRFDGFVLYPQNFYGTWISSNGNAQAEMYRDLSTTLELLEHLIQSLKIDPDRIVLQGISNGGQGAWYAAYKRPDLFAGVMPMSAHGDPAMASSLALLPLWVFQGGNDTNPPPHTTEKTLGAIREAAGKVRYSLYPEEGHNTWNKAYKEPDFFEWIMERNRKNHALNKFPQVNAGATQIILLPQDSTQVEGSAIDEDGVIVDYLWEKISGPEAKIHQPDAPNTKITGMEEGTYIFRLTSTDDFGAAGLAEVTLIVTSTPLGITSENPIEAAILYPNPFTDYIQLQFKSEKTSVLVVTLTNLEGKIVFQETISVNKVGEQLHTINFQNQDQAIKEGLYFVHIRDNKSNYSRKFTVKKE